MKHPPERVPLLYSREQVAKLLGEISIATVRRLEKAGKLKAVRLTGRSTGQVFYSATNVLALVREAGDGQS